MRDIPEPTFVSRVLAAPGQPVTIPAQHVTYDAKHGYSIVSGVGRQASTPGVAR